MTLIFLPIMQKVTFLAPFPSSVQSLRRHSTHRLSTSPLLLHPHSVTRNSQLAHAGRRPRHRMAACSLTTEISDQSSLCRDISRQRRRALRMNIPTETHLRSPAQQENSSWVLMTFWNCCPRGHFEPSFTARCSIVQALAPSRPSLLTSLLALFTRKRIVASSSIRENTKDMTLREVVLSCHKQDKWSIS